MLRALVVNTNNFCVCGPSQEPRETRCKCTCLAHSATEPHKTHYNSFYSPLFRKKTVDDSVNNSIKAAATVLKRTNRDHQLQHQTYYRITSNSLQREAQVRS